MNTSFRDVACLGSTLFLLSVLTLDTSAAESKPGGHAVPVDTKVIDRFKDVLKPGAEYRAVVEMEKGGQFEILFYPEVAPNHVANFVSLARKGFYDGLTFHRVLEGFMAQGGDPDGTGGGGPGYTIPAEFSKLPHKRGSVSMARTRDPNSAGSQFFICFAPTPFLDGQYTIFGEVDKGMEVVDKLKHRNPENKPSFEGDKMKKVTIKETGGS